MTIPAKILSIKDQEICPAQNYKQHWSRCSDDFKQLDQLDSGSQQTITTSHSTKCTALSHYCISLFWDRKNDFAHSYVVIMIAQAGATLIIRGTTPAYKAVNPRFPYNSRSRVQVETSFFDVPATCASPSSICRCVLTTSKGSVSRAANEPQTAPDANVRIRFTSVVW